MQKPSWTQNKFAGCKTTLGKTPVWYLTVSIDHESFEFPYLNRCHKPFARYKVARWFVCLNSCVANNPGKQINICSLARLKKGGWWVSSLLCCEFYPPWNFVSFPPFVLFLKQQILWKSCFCLSFATDALRELLRPNPPVVWNGTLWDFPACLRKNVGSKFFQWSHSVMHFDVCSEESSFEFELESGVRPYPNMTYIYIYIDIYIYICKGMLVYTLRVFPLMHFVWWVHSWFQKDK